MKNKGVLNIFLERAFKYVLKEIENLYTQYGISEIEIFSSDNNEKIGHFNVILVTFII